MKTALALMLVLAGMTFNFGDKQAGAQEMKPAEAPVAGGAVIGVAVTEMVVVANGWSARKQILGSTVYNDKSEKVGKVYDIIIAPDKAVSYAIVAAGGFLGIEKHDVAIPANQFQIQNGKTVLPGATKDAVKAMPMFQYAK